MIFAPSARIAAVAVLLVGLLAVPVFAEDPVFFLLPDKSLGTLYSLDSPGSLGFLGSLDPTQRVPESDSVKWGRDWMGLGRDTALIFSYQVVTIAVFYFLPESVSKWSQQAKNDIFTRWWDNVQRPRWDHDAAVVNYVGHPYFGAAYYTRARERGFGEFDSFVYAALASAMYEFGVEALFEHPSYQDLIVTPVLGAALGLAVEPIRSWIKLKPEPKWYDHLVLAATDPIGLLNGMFEKALGIKSDLRVDVGKGNRFHVELRMNWN